MLGTGEAGPALLDGRRGAGDPSIGGMEALVKAEPSVGDDHASALEVLTFAFIA